MEMKIKSFSHNSGNQIIDSSMLDHMVKGLSNINKPFIKGGAPEIRAEISFVLGRLGWSDKVRISSKQAITVTSKKGKMALCLQTGNMARFYADLLKLQSQFLDGKIEVAIYILPMQAAAKKLGDNIAQFERFTREIDTVFYKVITVPIIVLGFSE